MLSGRTNTTAGKNNTITVHIRHLREKMGDSIEHPKYIKTVWGADIKLKHKILIFYLKLIVSICAGLLFCLLLYYLVDTIWNGAVLDWFDQKLYAYQKRCP